MIYGSINLFNNSTTAFQNLNSAHPTYVELATLETETLQICIAVEKDVSKISLSEQYWGQSIPQIQYEALKGEILSWSLQSLIIEQSKLDGHIEITRNAQAECELYLLAKGETLFLHWDPTELYPHVNKDDMLDVPVVLAFLAMHSRYRYRTVLKDIVMLPERAHAVFKDGGLKVIQPPHIERPEAATLKEGADPVAMFHDLIKKSIERWPLDPEQVGVILSSGLDTTVVAHVLKEIMPHSKLRSFGYSMIDKERDAVKVMREETVQKLDLDDYYPLVEENIDEAYSLKNGQWWEGQTQTDFAEINLARKMADQGISLAFSGIGGDELCMLTGAEMSTIDYTPETPNEWDDDPYEDFSFIAESWQSKLPEEDEFLWPNGYVGISSPSMAGSVGRLFLREGVWCANPLGLVELQTFTKFLPKEWRHKRRLSRDILTRLGYSDYFVGQLPKETFGDTMDIILLNVDWQKVFENSILCNEGIIDKEKLFEGIEIFKKTSSVAVEIKLAVTLHIELSLQSVYQS